MPSKAFTERLLAATARTIDSVWTIAGNWIFSGRTTFSGRVTRTGAEYAPPVVSATTDVTLAPSTHAGKVVKTTVKDKDVTLPLASLCSGAVFSLLVGVAATVGTGVGATVKVQGTNKINGGTSGKGLINSGSTDAVGDCLTVKSDGANYLTIGKVGAWNAQA